MTKIALLCATAIGALSLAGVAAAAPAQTNLGGQVAPICEITNLNNVLNFPSLTSGASVSDNAVSVRCNDADGAIVSLTSSEGHLESDDVEDSGIGYSAVFTRIPVIGLNLTLNANSGTNDITAFDAVNGGATLAAGVNDANLTVTLNGTAVFAGGYSDTLSADIIAQ